MRMPDQRVRAASGQIVTRRELLRLTLGTGAMLAGGGLLAACGQSPGALGAPATLPPPETTSVRIVLPAACEPGLMTAAGYLREEGFTDIRYVDTPFISRGWVTNHEADFALGHPEFIVGSLDAGAPIVMLAGLHSGCLELWVKPGIQQVSDLRGRNIAVLRTEVSDQFYGFFATLLGYVGIDPLKDVQFIADGTYQGMIDAFLAGRADAFLAGAQQGPFFRRLPKPPGNVILETMTDKPWSQYLCCTLVGHRDFTTKNPIATKRFTRAVLRATDVAARDHARAAHDAVGAGGNFADEAIVRETMDMCVYQWRELDPEETLRFFALRLAEAKLIKSTPQQLINQGTDLVYMRQLRKELTP